MSSLGYVVVTFNQASGQPDLESGEIFRDLASAQSACEAARESTAEVGRRERHVVAELHEVD